MLAAPAIANLASSLFMGRILNHRSWGDGLMGVGWDPSCAPRRVALNEASLAAAEFAEASQVVKIISGEIEPL